MSDEDFHQMMLDWFSIEQQRHRTLMAQASDIISKITAIGAALDSMKANFDKAIGNMEATVPAGHASVLDTFIAPLEEVVTKVGIIGTEMESKTRALPVPGSTPPAAA